MKKIILAVFLLTIIFSCSKNENIIENSSPIVAKWYKRKEVLWTTPNSFGTIKDTTYPTGEYMDCKSNGIRYSRFWTGTQYGYDTSNYTLNGNVLHTTFGTTSYTWDVQLLTNDSLILHKLFSDSFNSYEDWTFWTK